MARRRKQPKVERVPIESRPLVIVRVGSPLPSRGLDGAIAWVEVPADTKPEEVEALRSDLFDHGVVGIKTLPRETRDRAVPLEAQVEPVEVPTAGDLRSVALELVDEANTSNRERLREAVELALEHVGL